VLLVQGSRDNPTAAKWECVAEPKKGSVVSSKKKKKKNLFGRICRNFNLRKIS
jgi:hypothetical protein